MDTEGFGSKAPAPARLVLDFGTQILIAKAATQRAAFRNYGGTRWGKGLKQAIHIPGIGDLSERERPIYAGLAGECAVADVINRRLKLIVAEVDLKNRTYGDGGVDLKVLGARLQVKTRQSHDRRSLIRATDERGNSTLPDVHAYVFCEWLGGDLVSVLGWLDSRRVVDRPRRPGKGDWMNVEVIDTELEPMNAMLDGFKKRLLQGVRA